MSSELLKGPNFLSANIWWNGSQILLLFIPLICIKKGEFGPRERYILELKFIYSEKGTKFCEIFPLLLSYVVPVKSKGKISQNFVAFSEYMNFHLDIKIYEAAVITHYCMYTGPTVSEMV